MRAARLMFRLPARAVADPFSLGRQRRGAGRGHRARCLEEGLALALEDWNEARSAEGTPLPPTCTPAFCAWKNGRVLLPTAPPISGRTRQCPARAPERGPVPEPVRSWKKAAQEAVILADRLDVERRAHAAQHAGGCDLLQTGGDAGRRLDFTLQGIREINTCGNAGCLMCSFRAWWLILKRTGKMPRTGFRIRDKHASRTSYQYWFWQLCAGGPGCGHCQPCILAIETPSRRRAG